MRTRGILSQPLVLHTRKDEIVVFPAGTQIAVRSDDKWQHDVQDADIQEAVELLKEE